MMLGVVASRDIDGALMCIFGCRATRGYTGDRSPP